MGGHMWVVRLISSNYSIFGSDTESSKKKIAKDFSMRGGRERMNDGKF
jgi:hypothetical protein